MADLNSAIQLIRQGQREAGQKILESVIKAEPGNITAWFWYVETCPTVERRIQVLETCLRVNPGNAQATQALQSLKSIPSAPAYTPPPEPPKPAPTPPSYSYEPEPEKPYFESSPFSSSYGYEDDAKTEAQPAYLDNTSTYAPAAQQPAASQKKPWEDPSAYEDNSLLSKPKPPARSYAFYDVWMTVLLSTDIESYEQVLNDPEAGLGRAFEWMAYAGLASGLMMPIALFINPQFSELMASPEFQDTFGIVGGTMFIAGFTLVMLIMFPIINIIGLALNAGIQNLLAVLFGGRGYFSRTAYAIAAYLAPMSVIGILVGLIPVVGGCLGLPISIYNFVLNVRALRAAHSLSTGAAIGVLIAPTIILFLLVCLILFGLASTAGTSIPSGGSYY
jgi:hypothetical protein